MKKEPLKTEDLDEYLGQNKAQDYYKYLTKYNKYLENYNEYKQDYNGYNKFFSLNWKAIFLLPIWTSNKGMWNFFIGISVNFFFMTLFLYLPTILGRTLFYAPYYLQFMVHWMPYLFASSMVYRLLLANALLFDKIIEVKEGKSKKNLPFKNKILNLMFSNILFFSIFSFMGYMELKDYKYKPFDQASHDAFEKALAEIKGKEAKIKILKTGQTKSYASYDDGATQRGEERNYTNNKNGTVTDNVTGLMWQDTKDVTHNFTWDKATQACQKLELGGYSDWRLPAIDELSTLIDLNNSEAPYINQVFEYRINSSFWSTTASHSEIDWLKTVQFHSANLYGSTKSSYGNNVRCIRTILQKKNGLIHLIRENNKKIILDTYTKLMFQDNSFSETEYDNSGNSFNYGRSLIWKDALSYCHDLSYGGYNDWFLPNRLEIYSYYDKQLSQYDISKFPNSSTLNKQNRYNDKAHLTICARKVK